MKHSKKNGALILSVVLALVLVRGALAEDPLREAFAKLRLLSRVFVIVEEQYVEEVSPEKLIYGAVNGMLSVLDPHSSFLTPELFRNLQVSTRGKFGGLGIEITIQNGVLTVVSPIAGTPADRAGLKSGDRIVFIEGRSTKDMTLLEAVNLMRGPKGSKITIGIMREGFSKPKDVEIVRDVIRVESVKSESLAPGYGYARIVSFQEHTEADLRKALSTLQEENLEGLVLDLRNNPGGLLDQAVKTADIFLDEGLIVYTEGRLKSARMSFSATRGRTKRDYPIVVLVNGGSASASEIVAGALQDHGRALVLGTRTFGKGSVQTIIPLDNTPGEETGLRLTTSLYFTPKGRSIQALGIEPDIPLERAAPRALIDDSGKLKESDLNRHFKARGKERATRLSPLLKKDNQIDRAYELLKSFNIFSGREAPAEAEELDLSDFPDL